MAERSVFISKDVYPFFEEIRVRFDYFQGFALSQKRKSQISIHRNFLSRYPEQKVLEISGGSLYSLGFELSAMNLKKQTLSGTATVESAFQSSKIFGQNGEIGPFPEYLFLPGRECKKLVKEQSGDSCFHHFRFDGMDFYPPKHCPSMFYNFLYLNALCEEENRQAADKLIAEEYKAFTDLATVALNTQARACAIYVSLVKNGLISKVRDYESYLKLFRTNKDGTATGRESYENVQLTDKKGAVQLLSPVVKCTFSKADTQAWYEGNCGSLSNRRDMNNYLDTV